jgi:hypothetical protein
MNRHQLRSITPTIDIYIRLAQYPILAEKIRERMRQELYIRGIVSPEQFEQEVRELSVNSQKREGLGDPFFEEDSLTWQIRQERIRDYHTDAYFANNLGTARLAVLIDEVLNKQSATPTLVPISFNPELAPWEMLFQQGEIYERMPPEELERNAHHLEEIKVVLIKRLMSDQLPFIGVAKRVIKINDLRRIHQNLIGTGKIGGKAAGTILAWRILKPLEEKFGEGSINIPDSFFIGTDVFYEFFLMNRLEDYMNQKYRPVHEIRDEYPRIVEAFLAADLPDYLVTQVEEVIQSLGNLPIVVRSSGLLEDNFGFSFVGKYNSYYCSNQGTLDENVACVLEAIRRIYASSLNPDALLYRQKHKLIDYDERMAILIQRVTGRQWGDYFFPDVAGVGFSQNPFCWTPEIRRHEGFLRIVTGMGVRAVDRIAQDYPRLIPLSHPMLRPEESVEGKRIYAQRLMAVIDPEVDQGIQTMLVRDTIDACGPLLPLIASLDSGGVLIPYPEGRSLQPDDDIVLTFDGLSQDAVFVEFMRMVLQQLEEAYLRPVDLEFAINVDLEPDLWKDTNGETAELPPRPRYQLHILECRPLIERRLPTVEIDPQIYENARQFFALPTLLPSAIIEGVEFLLFIDPECYYNLDNDHARQAIADTLARLNDLLPEGRFAMIGPGRWGSSNSRLSVPVTYSDICNSKLLIEISPPYTPAPELAYGTDFNEDLVEAGIYVLGIQPPSEGDSFNWRFLRESPNSLEQFIPQPGAAIYCLRLIDLPAVTGSRLSVYINDEENQAVAVFVE